MKVINHLLLVKLLVIFSLSTGPSDLLAAPLSDVEQRAIAELKAAQKIAKAQQKLAKKKAKNCRKAMSKIRALTAKGKAIPQKITDLASANCPRNDKGQLMDVDEEGNPILTSADDILLTQLDNLPMGQNQNISSEPLSNMTLLMADANTPQQIADANTPQQISEPGTLLLLGAGLLGIGLRKRKLSGK